MAFTFQTVNFSPRTVIGYIHLVYLGLLPSLATFGLLYKYGYPAPMILFLGGAAAVGVYIAVVFYYTPMPRSLAGGLLILLDGPAWVMLSLLTKKAVPLGYVVEGFIVEGTAIWLSILILAAKFPRRRLAAIGYMLLALGISVSLVYPYFRDSLRDQWLSVGLLGMGIVETFGTRFNQLRRDEEGRDKNLQDPNKNMGFLVVLILIWAAAMIAGNVLFELRHG